MMLELEILNDDIVIQGKYEEDYLLLGEYMNKNSELVKDYKVVTCEGFSSSMDMEDLVYLLGGRL